jgi:hypothetical protein
MATEKYYKFSAQTMFNRAVVGGIEAYVLTAYFVDPKTICQAGRDASRLKVEGTGSGLWLQNGTNPVRDSFAIPMQESGISSTKWVQGACFPTMGT